MARIQEIGVDEVKYKFFEDPEGPTYGIEKDRVVKIIFQNGRTETYRSGLRDPELYAAQKKQAKAASLDQKKQKAAADQKAAGKKK